MTATTATLAAESHCIEERGCLLSAHTLLASKLLHTSGGGVDGSLLLLNMLLLLCSQGNPAGLFVQLLGYIWPNKVDVKLVLRQQHGQLCKSRQQRQLSLWSCTPQRQVEALTPMSS